MWSLLEQKKGHELFSQEKPQQIELMQDQVRKDLYKTE